MDKKLRELMNKFNALSKEVEAYMRENEDEDVVFFGSLSHIEDKGAQDLIQGPTVLMGKGYNIANVMESDENYRQVEKLINQKQMMQVMQALKGEKDDGGSENN